LGLCSVCSVDFRVDWVVGVSGGEDAVVSVREDRGEGGEAGALGLVEHLALQLGKLVLQFRKGVGQGLHDAGVDGVKHALLGSTQILGSLQGRHVVAPELGLLCESSVLRVEVKVHLAQSSVGHLFYV